MQSFVFFPFLFLKFWYFEAPRNMVLFFLSLNESFLQLVSLPLLLGTFFRPLKNEYREGLVWFSLIMGIVVKTILISIGFLLFFILLAVELLFIIGFLLWPVATVLPFVLDYLPL